MYKKGAGNDKQGKEAGNRTLCPYRNFSRAIIHCKVLMVMFYRLRYQNWTKFSCVLPHLVAKSPQNLPLLVVTKFTPKLLDLPVGHSIEWPPGGQYSIWNLTRLVTSFLWLQNSIDQAVSWNKYSVIYWRTAAKMSYVVTLHKWSNWKCMYWLLKQLNA